MIIDEGEIDAAFLTHLLGFTPVWDTKYPGVAFKPDPLKAWQRGTLMSGLPEPVAFGDGVYSRMYGIYQVDLFYPKKTENVRELYTRAKNVMRRFWPVDCKGITLTAGAGTVNIEKRPSISRLIEDDPSHNQLHVDISFRADDAPAAA